MCEHSSFGGNRVTLPLQLLPRNVPLSINGSMHDEITSLLWALAPNVRVTFYHDHNGDGAQHTISANAPRVGSNPNAGGFHNDEFSSLMWQQTRHVRGCDPA